MTLRIAFILALGYSFLGEVAKAEDWQLYERGKIRVYYQTEGEDAVLATDQNGNGIPDQVEDTATQVEASHLILVDALGFTDPFASKRFNKAKWVEIFFVGREKMKNTTGITFDELQPAKDEPPGVKSISFRVASYVEPHSNSTPAHEYFHLIQYGSSYFKNNWYAEGTARWSQSLLGKEIKKTTTEKVLSWPLSPKDNETLSSLSYAAAERFFVPLVAHFWSDGNLPPHEAVKTVEAMRYANGTPVLKERKLAGWRFIRDWFKELSKIDEEAFRQQHYDRWSEVNQFSKANHPYLIKALERVIKKR